MEGTGTFDVETDSLGEAFGNTIAANRSLKPNRIWMSTTALIQFMNARTPSGGGGEPLYPSLSVPSVASVQVAPIHLASSCSRCGFLLSTTRPWTSSLGPAMDSCGLRMATYQLTADVPAKAGRDVGIVGMLFFAPVYPAAFTTYVVAT